MRALASRLFVAVAVGSGGMFVAAAPVSAQTAGAPFIAFTSDRGGFSQVYVMAPNGSGQRPLLSAPDGHDDIQPSISPDGARIVFSRGYLYQSGNLVSSSLVVADVEGGAERVLFEAPGSINFRPAWSPDGKTIAFVHGGPAQMPFDIWLVGADGSAPHAITTDGTSTYPAFSPDGTRIVFQHTNSQVYVMNADGSGQRQLTSTGLNYSPNWAPGTDVVFTRSTGGGGKQVWAMHPDGTNQHQVVVDTGEDKFPAWSPDGSRVIYSHGDAPCQSPGPCTATNNQQLWTVAADGSGAAQLTSAAVPELQFGESYPAWWAPRAHPPARAAAVAGASAGAGAAEPLARESRPPMLPATGRSTTELVVLGVLCIVAGLVIRAGVT